MKGTARAIFQNKHADKMDAGAVLRGWRMTAGNGLPLLAIVEDEPFMSELVCDMLSSAEVGTEAFMLGGGLLKSANLLKFQTILLDLSLPDIDIFDLMDILATDACGIPIVLMSGHDQATLRAAQIYGNGIGLQVRATLSKPFSQGDLFAVLGLPA
jgi:CheY-like chemotaxis protein